jgi:hypothetical protein
VDYRSLQSAAVPARTVSRSQAAYVALLTAHELSPGHHHHLEMMRSDLAYASDVLAEATGLEGWAVHAEGVAASLLEHREPFEQLELPRVALLHRLRRLLAALRWVVGRSQDGDAAMTTASFMRRLNKGDADFLGHVDRQEAWGPAHYGVGLVEIESAIEALSSRLHDRGLAAERLVAQGPLRPQSALRLALDSLGRVVGT